MQPISRLAAAAALVVAACASSAAWSQEYPVKPITVITSAAPGTSGDAALRMVSAKMSESLGKPVIVEPRTAARGGQAHAVVSKAAPDGYTITYGTSATFVYGRFLYKNLAFDVLKDYTPISMAVTSPSYVAVSKTQNIGSLKELLDYARANPGKLEYGSSGVGSFFHLAGEALKKAAGVDILHVPYTQANFPQLINDWASGRIAVWFPTLGYITPNAGKVNVLAIIDRHRSRHLPDVPAITELLPGYRPFALWLAFFGPAGLPEPVAARLASEVRKGLLAADVAPKLDELGLTAVGSTPQELGTLLREDLATIEPLVKSIGLKPE